MNMIRAACLSYAFVCVTTITLADGPVKVFVLAGQSNMQGHARLETFDYIGDDPLTEPLLKEMRQSSGSPRVCEGVWISYLTAGRDRTNGEASGPLTAGFGARRDPQADDGKIGPEFTFGITMDAQYDQPVLLIKTAWGGKSLFYDFRPPSAGPYQRTPRDLERDRNPTENAGHYYRLMIEHVKSVLADIGRVCPVYEPNQGYELAGFVWFQGWNDMVNRDAYPPTDNGGNRFAKYGELLGHLIRDVRNDLDVPALPVVIGVMGVGGSDPNENNAEFREAMAIPASLPEFRESVVVVPTAPFWDAKLGAIDAKYGQVRQMRYLLRTKNKNHANRDGNMSEQEQADYVKQYEAELISPEEVSLRARGASNAGYHYLGSAKTFAQIGRAFAEALLGLSETQTKD